MKTRTKENTDATTVKTRNGIDVEQLVETIAAIGDDPSLASFTFKARSTWRDGTHNTGQIARFAHAGQVNLWEETAWQGLVQRHWTARFGLGRGALLTAVPFAVIHLPLGFVGGTTLDEALIASILVLVMAPPLRYLLGRTDQATGGSLLAVGVLHASFNASGALDVLVGGWQHIVGVAVVTGVALLLDARRRTASPRTSIDAQLVHVDHLTIGR